MGLAGCIGYIAGNGGSSFGISALSSDADILKEIDELKTMYDAKISQKTASFKELKEEKAKVAQLVFELEKTKADAEALVKYKTEFQNLESKMHVLVDEIVVLKTKKSSAIAIKKATKSVVENTTIAPSFPIKNSAAAKATTKPKTVVEKKEPIETNQKEIIAKTETPIIKEVETPVVKKVEVAKPVVEKFEKVAVSNIKAAGFDVKSASKSEQTNYASRTDVVKVQFTLEANPKAKAEEVKFYIQVIDANNNVMGRKITEFFDDKSLTYSYSRFVNYENETMNVEQELLSKNFEKGTYFVNVFERSKLVAKTSFTLK